jgi:hypothetical protein
LRAHRHDAGDEIVDEAEAAGLRAGALDGEREPTGGGVLRRQHMQAHRELRDHVLEPHVGSIDVVRAEDQHAIEEFAPVVDRHDLADELARPVRIARVERIGHRERGALVGRDFRRRLIDLGARSEQQGADAVPPAGIDHVDHPTHADVEHELRRRVEEFGAVDEGEVVHLVRA